MQRLLLSGIIVAFFCAECARADVPLEGHRGGVTAVAVSPDGKFIVTGGKDRVLILRDGTTGNETKRLEAHKDAKESIDKIVFDEMSSRFASAGGKSVLVWRVGESTPEPPFPPIFGTSAVAFSPDGGQLATGLRGVVLLWNLPGDTSSLPRECPFPGGATTNINFFDSGNFFTTTGNYDAVLLWTDDGKPDFRFDSKHRSGVIAVDLSSDGRRIITGGKDKTAAVWEIKGYGKDRTIDESVRFALHRNDVTFVAFGSDPQTVITASLDKTLQQWDTKELDGKSPKVWLKKEFAAAITTAATTASRDRFVILTADGKATLYTATELGLLVAADAAQKSPSPFLKLPAAKLIRRWEELLREPNFVAFNQQGRLAVARSSDGGEVRSPNAEDVIKFGDKRPMTTVTFNGNGSVVVAGRDDGTIIGYDATTGKELKKFSGHALPVRAVCFSPNGERIVTGSDDTKIHLWNASNGSILGTFSGHTQPVRGVAVSPDQSTLASGSDDGTLRLWTTDKFQTLHTIKHSDKQSDAVLAVVFSPDGKHIVSGSRDKSVIITKCGDTTQETVQVKRINFGDAVTSLAFTPDGAWLVVGSLDGTAVIVDAASWTPKRVCLPRALPDPKYEEIKIRGEPPQPPLLPVTSISVSPDGKYVVTAGGGTTQLWSLEP